MATIEDFMKAAEGMENVTITPLTMEDVYNVYGEAPSNNEDNMEYGDDWTPTD